MRRALAGHIEGRLMLEPLEARLLLDGVAGEQAIELFGISPALFVENQGQWADESVRYAFQGSGANVAFTDAGLLFQVFQAQEPAEDADAPAGGDDPFAPEGTVMRGAEFSVSFDGANEVAPAGLDQSQGVFNYYVGEQSNWRSNVPAYETISYPGLYDGIDLYTWGRRDGLKYEFHVAPGADYRQVQVSYDGIEGLWLDSAGALHVQTELGELIDDAPYIYQEIAGERVDVAGAFQLIDADTYGFSITGQYDPSAELIIDPYMVWSTYLGGGAGDVASGIAVDSLDNVLVAGATSSPGWLSGGFDTTYNGNRDAFVVKISPSGEHIWSTYVGGDWVDWANGIAVDSLDNVLLTGGTYSSGWVSGGFDITHNGSGDGFVAKISASGQHIWSTYVGGSQDDIAWGIAVDSVDNVLVGGWTTSPGWLSGGFDTSHNGDYDGFVAKLSASGQHIWSTYLGGGSAEYAHAIAVDSLDNVLVTGPSESSGWVSGGFDTSYNGEGDAFAAKLSPSGQHVWSTYLGGSGADYAYGIAVDSLDNVLVAGETTSPGWVSGGFDTTYNGGDCDGFVARISPSGGHIWSTYLGGTEYDGTGGIAVDSLDNVLVTGPSESSGWVSGGFDTTYNGEGDAFAAKLSASGAHIWSTYVGGGTLDWGYGMALDSIDNVLVAGWTTSSGWVWGGFDTTFGGGPIHAPNDGFVVKIGEGSPALGDANGDGLANGADYTIWADNYLDQPVPAWVEGGWMFGNFTAGDTVDGADYTIWADNFTGVGGGSAGALPAAGGANGVLMQALLEQGVPAERIVGVDSDGIPLVSGVPGDAESASSPAHPAGAAALPLGVRGWETIPGIIRNDGVETFRVEVDVNGPVAGVTLDMISSYLVPPGPEPVSLRDDGTGGDLVAGDFIFTSGLFRYDTARTMPEFYEYSSDSPAGLYSTSVGSLTIEELDATTTRFLINPEYGLLRSDIPEVPTVSLSPDIIASPHLINVQSGNRETQLYLRGGLGGDLRNLTNPIYQVLPDDFDFFMLLSTYKVEEVPWLSSRNFTSGLHVPVQVNYTGTGRSPFDASAQFGSAGRLLSVNILDTYDRGIKGSNATHELVHQWACFTSMSLGLNDGTSHYKPRSSVASMVGGFEWIDNGDGTFTVNYDEGRGGAHHAPPLDKYMMGLIEAGDVPTLYVYSDELPYPGFLEEPIGPEDIALTVTIDDIIGVHGVRSPGPAEAQRDFTIAFVAESLGRLLNPTEMTFYEVLARHYTKELPPEEPDPYISHGWQTITRFFGEGTTWSSLIEAVLPVPGDADMDGLVDGVDYTIWADHYHDQPVPAWVEGGWMFGNFTAGDKVDGADYTIWADNFTDGGGGSTGALPAADGAAGEEDVLRGAAAGGHVWSVLSAAPPSVMIPRAESPVGRTHLRRNLPTIPRASLHALPGLSNPAAEASRQSAYPGAAWGGTGARTPPAEGRAALDDEIDLLAGPDLSPLALSV